MLIYYHFILRLHLSFTQCPNDVLYNKSILFKIIRAFFFSLSRTLVSFCLKHAQASFFSLSFTFISLTVLTSQASYSVVLSSIWICLFFFTTWFRHAPQAECLWHNMISHSPALTLLTLLGLWCHAQSVICGTAFLTCLHSDPQNQTDAARASSPHPLRFWHLHQADSWHSCPSPLFWATVLLPTPNQCLLSSASPTDVRVWLLRMKGNEEHVREREMRNVTDILNIIPKCF